MTNCSSIERIFLVDDDDDDQLIFIEALAKIDPDIKCETALDGKEAFKKLNTMNALPDLIFLDINMPGEDGFECLAKLKQHEQFSKIPVIIFSTAATNATIIKAQLFGADAFLTKPIEHLHLELKLKKILATDFTIPSSQIRIFSHQQFSF